MFLQNSFDAVLQQSEPFRISDSLLVNTEGTGNLQNVLPPDPVGDIGRGYYVQMLNMSMAVYNKKGELILDPVPT